MKSTLSTILIILLFISCSSKKENDLVRAELHGDVVKVSEYTYEAVEKFGDITKGKLQTYTTTKYDEHGNNIEYIYTRMPDSLENEKKTRTTTSKFNNQDQRIAVADPKTGQILAEFKYNDDGKCYEIINLQDGKKSSVSKNFYDENGNLKESKDFNSNGGQESRSTFKFNKDKKLVQQVEFNKDNEKESTIYSYNKEGLLISYTTNKKDYKYKRSFKYTAFDSNNNWIKKISYYNDSLSDVIERKIEYR
jgi:hypothetical protein